MSIFRKTTLFTLAALLILTALPACSTRTTGVDLKMASMGDMPEEVKNAPVSVQQAYQFAVANAELMKQMPCYCGCGDIGHTSNYACYVADVDAQGNVTYDNHALGCSICVDITLDVMRMTRDGKSPVEIRAAIDATYSKYGTSNIP